MSLPHTACLSLCWPLPLPTIAEVLSIFIVLSHLETSQQEREKKKRRRLLPLSIFTTQPDTMPLQPSSFDSGEEDLQIEISANDPADLFAVMVTRADTRVESVVCIPNSTRGRAIDRDSNGLRPDPERFKSPIKDGRRSALAGLRGDEVQTENGHASHSSKVQFIPDDVDEVLSSSSATRRGKLIGDASGQRFHLRIAYPNGFTKRSVATFDGACSKNSMSTPTMSS